MACRISDFSPFWGLTRGRDKPRLAAKIAEDEEKKGSTWSWLAIACREYMHALSVLSPLLLMIMGVKS